MVFILAGDRVDGREKEEFSWNMLIYREFSELTRLNVMFFVYWVFVL